MGDAARQIEGGPAESRLVRRVLYLGEGLLLGVVLYAGILFAITTVRDQSFLAVVIISVIIALPKLFLLLARPEDWHRPPHRQEWADVRRWRWVFLLGLLVAVVLVGGSVLAWAWTWPQEAVYTIMGGALLGVLVWVSALYLIERKNPELRQIH